MAKSRKLSDFRQQAMNANKHTERGMKALEASMNEVGYTAPMIAAADGEIIAGSARHETAASVFGADVYCAWVTSQFTRRHIHHAARCLQRLDDLGSFVMPIFSFFRRWTCWTWRRLGVIHGV